MTQTPFAHLGGHAMMQAIADRFYTLMDSDAAYAQVRAMHAADMAPVKASLAGFLAGWTGGPRDWFTANPGRCMMSIHAPYAISSQVAGQWAEAMGRTIAELLPDSDMAAAMSRLLADMATAMGR